MLSSDPAWRFLYRKESAFGGDRQTPKTSCIRDFEAIVVGLIRRFGIGPKMGAMDVACDCHAYGD